MTDDPHVDETQPDQAHLDRPSSAPTADPTPKGFGDLPLQPTGSGVADEQTAFERAGGDEPPENTAGFGNTGLHRPPVEGGQPPVGAPSDPETRNTEF
jgi:hypothetical protein